MPLADALKLSIADYRERYRMAATNHIEVTLPWLVIVAGGGWEKACEAAAWANTSLKSLHPSGVMWVFTVEALYKYDEGV